MNKSISISMAAVLFATTLLLGGCASKQATGAAIGAGAGAVVGHQFGGGRGQTAMTIIGAIAGAAIGGQVGASMDAKDRQRTAYALQNNSIGETSTWTNPDTGRRYSVTPTDVSTRNSEPCRTFVFKSYDAQGQAHSVTRLACRQPDGSWQIED